jgi:hypothetical protein
VARINFEAIYNIIYIILHIIDLTKNVKGAKLVLSADYTSSLITGKDEFDLQHNITRLFFDLIINTEKSCNFIQKKCEFC